VSEDKYYKKYSHTLSSSPKMEPEMAMWLMHFRKIKTNNLCPVKEKKSREEESVEITRQIIYSTIKWNPL